MKDFTISEALELARAGRAQIIDIRTAAEIAQGSLPGARALPTDLAAEDFESFVARLKDVMEGGQITILMCRSGSRSKYLQTELAAVGISVGNLLGGIICAQR